MDINLERYRTFYHVVKAGSISAAAQALCISQPAVSQAVKQLERHLGGQLFFRTAKGIKLTPEGQVLFQYIEQGYALMQMAEDKFAEVLNLEAGEIRIGASDMTLRFFLLPHLESFHKLHPKVKIRVTNGPTPEVMRSLKKGLIDFGVISLPAAADKSLHIVEAAEIQDCFVAGNRFKAISDMPLSFMELAGYPLIMLEKNTSTRNYIDALANKQGVELNPDIELATSDLIVQFAERGLGIACVVRSFAEEAIARGDLFEIRLNEDIPPRKLGILTQKDMPLSPSARRFLELVNS